MFEKICKACSTVTITRKEYKRLQQSEEQYKQFLADHLTMLHAYRELAFFKTDDPRTHIIMAGRMPMVVHDLEPKCTEDQLDMVEKYVRICSDSARPAAECFEHAINTYCGK